MSRALVTVLLGLAVLAAPPTDPALVPSTELAPAEASWLRRAHRAAQRAHAAFVRFLDALDPQVENPMGIPQMRPGSLAWRLKRHFGMYMGVGVRVPLRKKARWYVKRYGVPRAVLGVTLALLGLPALAGWVMPAPANSVWAGGLPREWVTIKAKIKTTTNLKSGVFVERDTTNDEFKACGAGSAVVAGVLSERNWDLPDWDGSNTGLAAAQICDVIMMVPGTIVKVRNGANLTFGALLNTDASGQIAAAAVAAAGDIPKVIGKLLVDNDGSGTATATALVALGF